MPHQNTETLRRQVDAFNRGDLEAWLITIHPSVTFAPISASIEGVYEGHEGLRLWFADNRESFESFRVSHTDVRDLGDDRLLAIGTIHLRARGSGIETDVPTAAIATWRDGMLIDWKDYGDPDEATVAAGLGQAREK
jgi:ketosteroid isomerase-like protein